MVERTLAQHAGPAPDGVREHRHGLAERTGRALVGRAEDRGDADAGRRRQMHRAGIVRHERTAGASTPASVGRSVRPMRLSNRAAARCLAPPRRPVPASAALPTITDAMPSAASDEASSANYSDGHCFAPPYAAPGASATSGARPSQPASIKRSSPTHARRSKRDSGLVRSVRDSRARGPDAGSRPPDECPTAALWHASAAGGASRPR